MTRGAALNCFWRHETVWRGNLTCFGCDSKNTAEHNREEEEGLHDEDVEDDEDWWRDLTSGGSQRQSHQLTSRKSNRLLWKETEREQESYLCGRCVFFRCQLQWWRGGCSARYIQTWTTGRAQSSRWSMHFDLNVTLRNNEKNPIISQ